MARTVLGGLTGGKAALYYIQESYSLSRFRYPAHLRYLQSPLFQDACLQSREPHYFELDHHEYRLPQSIHLALNPLYRRPDSPFLLAVTRYSTGLG